MDNRINERIIYFPIGLSDNFPSRCPFPSGRIFSGDAHLSDGKAHIVSLT